MASPEAMDSKFISSDDGTFWVTEGRFFVKKIKYNLKLTENFLVWKPQLEDKKGNLKNEVVIPISHVLAVNIETKTETESLLNVHYIQKENKNLRLRRINTAFSGSSSACSEWANKIQAAVNEVSSRPKKLLVVVNPKSGFKKGVKIYQSSVEPIFHQAGIETEMIVTERSKHATEILATHDLTGIDGIVLMGGDGHLYECANGLLRRLQVENSVDIDNPDVELVPLRIPIGMIPTGTGNVLAVCVQYGNRDIETAVLSIVIGKRKDYQVFSVYADGKQQGFGCLCLGFGFWGDIGYKAMARQSLRLNALKYGVTVVDSLRPGFHRLLDLDLKLLITKESSQDSEEGTGKENKSTWIPYDGQYTSVNMYIFDVAETSFLEYEGKVSNLEPKFPDPMDLTVMLHRGVPTRSQMINYYRWIASLDSEKLKSLDFIELRKVCGYKLSQKSERDHSTLTRRRERTLNIDGELVLIEGPAFEFRLQPGLVQYFYNSACCNS